jgi:type I restriction enzyme S subunit
MTRTGNTGEVVTNVAGAFHNNFFKIKFDKSKVNKNFIVYFLKLLRTQKIILTLAGSSTIPDLNHDGFYRIEMAFSTLKEQTKIGNYFQQLDTLIAQHQQKHNKLLNLKKALLEKMFPKQGATVPEIRFEGFSEEWVEKLLGEIGTLKNGMNFDKTAMGHGHPFVNLQDVFGKNEVSNNNLGLAFSTANQRKEYSLNIGDVLFIRSSVKPEGVGEAAVISKKLENTTYSGFIIRFRPTIEMDVNFNRFVYSTNNSRRQILASSTSSANSNINQDSLQRIQLTLPCKKEQTKIGTLFKNLDTLITQHQAQLNKLNNIKQACLEKMFV